MTDEIKSVDEVTKQLELDEEKERRERLTVHLPDHLDIIPVTPAPELDASVSFLDVFVNWFKQSITTSFLNQYEGKAMDLKGYIVQFLVQWILHLGGGVLLTVGISASSWTEIVGAIVAFITGTVMHLIAHNTAINTDPKTLAK